MLREADECFMEKAPHQAHQSPSHALLLYYYTLLNFCHACDQTQGLTTSLVATDALVSPPCFLFPLSLQGHSAPDSSWMCALFKK
jgi:hypothetical protein